LLYITLYCIILVQTHLIPPCWGSEYQCITTFHICHLWDSRHKLVQYELGSGFIYECICLSVHSGTASSFRILPQS